MTIEELDLPAVPFLRANNPTDTPILVVEGEQLLGGRQNRCLNASVIAGANAEVELPVSCVERGRWSRKGKDFMRSKAFAPRRVRRVIIASVLISMESMSQRYSAQRAVWREIDQELQHANVASPRGALEDLSKRYDSDAGWVQSVRELERAGPLPEQCGFAVAHGGRFVAIEIFGAHDLLAANWNGQMQSYLREHPVRPGKPSPTWALRAIRRFGRRKGRQSYAAGAGWEKRLRTDQMVGQALMLEDSLVHASLFMSSAPS